MIYNFLYLDHELVRSLLSQMDKGLLQSSTQDKSHKSSVESGGKGKIPGIAEIGSGAGYEYTSSKQETKSLHHYAFTVFMDYAKEHGLIGGEKSPITSVQGSIRFLDGERLSLNMERLPSLIKGMEAAMKFADEPQDFSELSEMKNNAKHLAGLISGMTGNSLMARIEGKYVYLDRSFIHSEFAPELRSNGREFEGPYKLIGIHSSSIDNGKKDDDDPLIGLVDALGSIERAFIENSNIKPIAIYREISA